MKVLLLNGSPHENGCTFTALSEIAIELAKQGIDSKIIHLGAKPVTACAVCGSCSRVQPPRCVFNDVVNEVIAQLDDYDAFVFGSPVHYAGISSIAKASFDRLFVAACDKFAHKPGAAVVTARRAGTTSALEQLNKYFGYAQMPTVGSLYWNMAHGNTPAELRQDEEGMQIMRVLARNMAWLLHCIEAGKKAGIVPPAPEEKIRTNYIR